MAEALSCRILDVLMAPDAGGEFWFFPYHSNSFEKSIYHQ
jgi:hypothetical protein